MEPDWPTTTGLSRGERDILRRAATSALNLEPVCSWRLQVHGHTIDLCADPAALDHPPVRAQRLHVSAGAALVNVRVAARRLGLVARVHLLPDQTSAAWSGLLARVVLCADVPPTLDEAKLYGAIPSRRTGDRANGDQPEPAALWRRLADAAVGEGTRLRVVPGLNGHSSDNPAVGTRGPAWALLGTDRDDPADWLRAGQALQLILLLATVHGAAISLVAPPRGSARPEPPRGNTAGRLGATQMVLRLG